MFLLLLVLAQSPAPQETQASLQSCEMTAKGWVCHYQIPSTTIVRPLDPVGSGETAASGSPVPLSTTPPPARPGGGAVGSEAARQARLIAKCADASWLSLCLPGERKEARVLRDAAAAAAALRGKVTGLLSENRCDEAVKTALEGGDLTLARDAREFCAPRRP